jgi:hypothetical protein
MPAESPTTPTTSNRGCRSAGGHQTAPAGEQEPDPDRHVEQERRPPRGTGQVQRHYQPADDLTGRHAEREDHRVERDRPGPAGPIEVQLDQ